MFFFSDPKHDLADHLLKAAKKAGSYEAFKENLIKKEIALVEQMDANMNVNRTFLYKDQEYSFDAIRRIISEDRQFHFFEAIMRNELEKEEKKRIRFDQRMDKLNRQNMRQEWAREIKPF